MGLRDQTSRYVDRVNAPTSIELMRESVRGGASHMYEKVKCGEVGSQETSEAHDRYVVPSLRMSYWGRPIEKDVISRLTTVARV